MRVLGLSGYFHDSAAALVCEDALVAAAQEERFTRRKHDAGFPLQSARFCLGEAGLDASELDAVVWHEKPLLKFERVLLTSLRTFPRGLGAFRRAMVSMVGDKLWVRSHITSRLGVDPRRVLFSDHHRSHAAAAYLTSPFDDAAVLCADGVGEWASTSKWAGRGGGLEARGEIHFPHSIGLLYSVVTAFLGFEVNEGEYKVMGLAAFGEPRYRDAVESLIRRHPDGSFALDLDHFCFHYHADRSWTRRFEVLFGAPREPEAPIEQRHKDVAASFQIVVEELLLDLCRQLHAETGLRHLCMAGGVALNAKAVGRIIEEGPFADVYVLPPAGDAGAALGAALVAAGRPRIAFDRPGWGPDLDAGRVRRFLRDARIDFEEPGDLGAEVAARLARGQVVGWIQGRFEFGPRALGHRSILCDPRKEDARDLLNRRIKFREAFRPFAPSVLREASAELFDAPRAGASCRRFMTSCVRARNQRVAGAVHVDGSARVQEVDAAVQPLFASLLREFGKRSDVPCLINTSFNLSGEPIVASVSDGYASFLRSQIDVLAVGPFLVKR